MVRELALFWLSSGASLQAHQSELDAWASEHQLALQVASPTIGTVHDPALAEAVELQLESVRATLALDQADVGEIIERVRQDILNHPELPQAAWLLAECHRLAALALLRGGTTLAAAEQRETARALEGASARAYSDSTDLAPLRPTATVEIELVGPRSGDVVYLDGEARPARALALAGQHHVRVVRGPFVIWVGWLEVQAEGGRLGVPVQVPACSAEDLWGVRVQQGQVHPATGTRCAQWVAALPSTSGRGIEIARCQADRCQPLAPWPRRATRPAAESGGGAWYVWPLLGAGVTLGTAVVLWQAGVFDRPEPGGRTFTVTGPGANSSAIQF